MPMDLPEGTVTFLFTDIEGSTRLLREMGDAYADALAEHRRILRGALAAHNGIEVDTQGDAFFCAFAAASDAVAAASDAQAACADGPIRVRMGLHTGEPLRTAEGYVGLAVHVGARICAAAHGGQVVLSKATRDLVAADTTDLGEHRLKDVTEAIWLFQLGDRSFPPLRTISNTNLPRPASSFIGREVELREAQDLLERGRLLTISGPGGTGKTRFAIELASRQRERFPNGVFWVPLAGLEDSSLVLEIAAQTMGAKGDLAAHISDKRVLICFDNFEQVIGAAPSLSRLVQECGNLSVLATSREALGIDGETEYSLMPLQEEESAALFCTRARAQPSEVVTEICRRLDGLPLAIELAAARAKLLTPEQLLDYLGQRLDLLQGGRDADARHATLRATIAWSYDLLSEPERRLFARLAVFAGGFTLAAADQVTAADLDTLTSLVGKSLVRRTGERLSLLETIREFALEHLRRTGLEAELRRAHAEFFLALAERADQELRGPQQIKWIERLDAEHANLRAALRWALEGADPLLGVRLAGRLMWFWQIRSYLGEGESWLAMAADAAAGVPPDLRARLLQGRGQLTYYKGDPLQAQGLLAEAVALWRLTSDARSLAQSLTYLGISAGHAGDAPTALGAGAEAVALAREDVDDWTRGLALWGLGANRLLGRLGNADAPSASLLLEESVDLLRRTGDGWALSAPLFYLGTIALEAGDLGRARRLTEESARLFGAAGDRWRLRVGLAQLAAIAEREGDADRAQSLRAESESVGRELGQLRAGRATP